ncbi:B-cell lymphoma 6 like protein [Cucumispora dikerogammari]|nr:B-cell lymphoma 6 like protein [Cucumispora dikerogammari]
MLKQDLPKCKICNLFFKTIYGYKDHMLYHCAEANIYHCPECNIKFKCKKTLNTHINQKHITIITIINDLLTKKTYKNIIRLREFIYINDFTSSYNMKNYLLNGGMCQKCLRCPEKEPHKCVKNWRIVEKCVLCDVSIIGVDYFVHALSSACKRKRMKVIEILKNNKENENFFK